MAGNLGQVDLVGQAQQAVAPSDVGREAVVVAGGTGETRRGPGQEDGRQDCPREGDVGLLAQRPHEQPEEASGPAAVVGLPHPELEKRQPIGIEGTAPAVVP